MARAHPPGRRAQAASDRQPLHDGLRSAGRGPKLVGRWGWRHEVERALEWRTALNGHLAAARDVRLPCDATALQQRSRSALYRARVQRPQPLHDAAGWAPPPCLHRDRMALRLQPPLALQLHSHRRQQMGASLPHATGCAAATQRARVRHDLVCAVALCRACMHLHVSPMHATLRQGTHIKGYHAVLHVSIHVLKSAQERRAPAINRLALAIAARCSLAWRREQGVLQLF